MNKELEKLRSRAAIDAVAAELKQDYKLRKKVAQMQITH